MKLWNSISVSIIVMYVVWLDGNDDLFKHNHASLRQYALSACFNASGRVLTDVSANMGIKA